MDEKISSEKLLNKFQNQKTKPKGHLLNLEITNKVLISIFSEAKDKTYDIDIYNITAPFIDSGEHYLAARIEPRNSELSKVGFFMQKDNEWLLDTKKHLFDLQDPFLTFLVINWFLEELRCLRELVAVYFIELSFI